MRRRPTTALLAVAVLLTGCAKSADEPSTPADLSTSPQYVNRLVPGHRHPAVLRAYGSQDRNRNVANTVR